MGERLLNTEDVLAKVGFGKTWLEERIAEGSFPRPTHKWRRNKWREQDVDEWIMRNFGDRQEGPPKPEESRVSH
jgi:predicted DNA-binding transcriptional regulator AlpA